MNKQFFKNILPGTLLFSRFRLETCLSAKDTGAVYRCRDVKENGKTVALKVVLSCLDDGEAAQKLFDELSLSQSVRHPHVLRAEAFYADDEFRAYTMEYMEGGTLQGALQSRSISPLKQQVNVLWQICEGLEAIHNAQIIHRDLKPDNVLVASGYDIRIADFGIATQLKQPTAINDSCITGTIDYLSPEYVLEGQSSRLSDIYAVGVIAYQLVTGRLPYDSESIVDLLSKKTLYDPVAPIKLAEECPLALNDFIMTAMARRPEQRAQSVQALLERLDRLPTSLKPSQNDLTTRHVA